MTLSECLQINERSPLTDETIGKNLIGDDNQGPAEHSSSIGNCYLW